MSFFLLMPLLVYLPQADLPPQPHPSGMVWIPGGTFDMGCDGAWANPDEAPVHRIRLEGFWIDRTEVSNRSFMRFVEETGYRTTAEVPPAREDIMRQLPPGSPEPDPASLVAGSLVFTAPVPGAPLDGVHRWWQWTKGAQWRHPEGREGQPFIPDEPVVHVSWFDAMAYVQWSGRSLPTEAQWEFAARGGAPGRRYTWGEKRFPDSGIPANIWEGRFPVENLAMDGYPGRAPVGQFPANGYGLHDMAGNVWEWCLDWYRPDTYVLRRTGEPVQDPVGPPSSFDPREPTIPKRVTRGGSFLCSDTYCTGYRPSARMKTSPDTGLSHTGFRCVMTDAAWRIKSAGQGDPTP